MKINSLEHVTSVYNSQKSVTSKAKRTADKKDELLISSEAKDIQLAYKLVKQVPDIRKEKVDHLKNQIQTGTYNVNLEEIVDKMINSIDLKG
jgi:negative regulator of flagellin synthesis FlgM